MSSPLSFKVFVIVALSAFQVNINAANATPASMIKRSPAKIEINQYAKYGHEEPLYDSSLYQDAGSSGANEGFHHDYNEEGDAHEQVQAQVPVNLLRQDIASLRRVRGFLPGQRHSRLRKANGQESHEIEYMLNDIQDGKHCQMPHVLHDNDLRYVKGIYESNVEAVRHILSQHGFFSSGRALPMSSETTLQLDEHARRAVLAFNAMRKRYSEISNDVRSNN